MKTLSFDIELGTAKTKFVPYDKQDLVYLIDSGADTPVWCKGKEEFCDIYEDAERIPVKFLLSGFGTGIDVVDVYKIPVFELTDGVNSIHFFFKKGELTDDQMRTLGIEDKSILKGVYWEE